MLLAQLAIFVGGFSMPAAIGVTGMPASGRSVQDTASLALTVDDAVASLAEKSLLQIQRSGEGEPRMLMSETIREFALEQLQAVDHFERIAGAHAVYFMNIATEAEPVLMGPDPMPRFHSLERDLGNLRAALAWFQSTDRVENALRLVGALAWFWTEPRYLREGREWYASLLQRVSPEVAPDVRAKALVAAGDLAQWQFDTDAALALHEEGLRLWREVGNADRIAGVLRSLASVALERREYEQAEELLAESRNLALQAGNSWEVAAATNLLGVSELFRGQVMDAIERHREAVRIWEELGDIAHVVAALGSLGWACIQSGQIAESAGFYAKALQLASQLEDVVQIAWCVTGAAVIALVRDADAIRAATLFAAAETIRERTGTPTWASTRDAIAVFVDQARNQSAEQDFANGWLAGQGMSVEEVEELAGIVFMTPPPVR